MWLSLSYWLMTAAITTSLKKSIELTSDLVIMECRTIMHSPPSRLYVDNTVREAIDMLIERHMYNLPVVDRDEIFIGEISARRLLGLMLPASLSMEMGLKHTGFMRETKEGLRERLDKVGDQAIAPYIATDITVVYPDSPLIDALMLLYHKYIRIPVVERDSGRLVGGISFITLLRALEEKS
jgi:CBS domain-containing protein